MDLKNEPALGDLIFVHGTGPISRAIEWAENGPYSHVALYAGRDRVLEAQDNRKSGYAPLSKYEGVYDIGQVRGVTNMQRMEAVAFARRHIGARYAWGAILVLALKLLLHLQIPYKQRLHEFICSFYVADAWSFAGKVLTNEPNPTPQDLANSPEINIVRPT